MEGEFSMGIKSAKIATENAKSDFKATIDRIAVASRWKQATIEDWLSRGELVCADLMKRAEEVMKKAEVREEAEAKIRLWRVSARCWQNWPRRPGSRSQLRWRPSS
jgi:hypothetical protein